MKTLYAWVQSTWKGQPIRLFFFIAVVSIILIGYLSAPFQKTQGYRQAKRNEELLVQLAHNLKLSMIRSSQLSVRGGTANASIVVSKESWRGIGNTAFASKIISQGWIKTGSYGYCMDDMVMKIDDNCKDCRGVEITIDFGPTAKYKCSLSDSMR